MSKRLSIGVTGPDRGGMVAWIMTALAVWRCGGRAVRITPAKPREDTELHGLIIGGGTDVDPFHYDEATPESVAEDPDQFSSILDWVVGLVLSLFRALFATGSSRDYDPARDALETRLIQDALAHQLPVLGICRGAQLMNVVLGGSLHQSIEHFYTEETSHVRSILPRKWVSIAPESRLQKILQVPSCTVNALHDQSIDRLGDGISISATERSGVIQAMECGERDFFIGVQWHPEYMPQSSIQRRLFRVLVDTCTRTHSLPLRVS